MSTVLDPRFAGASVKPVCDTQNLKQLVCSRQPRICRRRASSGWLARVPACRASAAPELFSRSLAGHRTDQFHEGKLPTSDRFTFSSRNPFNAIFWTRSGVGHGSRTLRVPIRAMDASFAGEGQEDYGPPPPFPRLGVRDPYKLLGVSRDASDEEVREAHNYLSNQYWGHEKSREAIEAAYDKIIMESFRDRKNSKINLKSSLKKKVSEAPPQIRAITNMIEIPPTQTIGQRAALFLLLGVWSVMNPAEGGPAFQVAVSLAACIYFLNDRLKSLGRAFLLGFGALVVGWVSGSFLIPVLSSYVLPPSWSLELSTALFSYIFLWAACTFLK